MRAGPGPEGALRSGLVNPLQRLRVPEKRAGPGKAEGAIGSAAEPYKSIA